MASLQHVPQERAPGLSSHFVSPGALGLNHFSTSVKATEKDLYPLSPPRDSVLPGLRTNQNHLVLASFPHHPLLLATRQMAVSRRWWQQFLKEVGGGSTEEVSHNARVSMAIFIGSSGLEKHLDSSLVTEPKIASSQELVFPSHASVRG